MKNTTYFGLLLLVCAAISASAEIVTITEQGFQSTSSAYTNTYMFSMATNGVAYTSTVVVREGEFAKILYTKSVYTLGFLIGTTNTQSTNYTAFFSSGDGQPQFVGPGYFKATGDTGLGHVAYTVQIIRNDQPFVPNGAVLVPADTAGPVNVIMETSTNLVSWAAALPGTYGSTSQNQYFRVRAVHQ